jgi:hypothetical protein
MVEQACRPVDARICAFANIEEDDDDLLPRESQLAATA